MDIRELVARWSKDWGVRLAAIAGTITTVVASNQDILIGLITLIPAGPARLFVAVGLGVAIFGIPTVTRILEDKLTGKSDADEAE